MDDASMEKYFPIIKKYFPECKKNKIKFFNDGCDHYVFVLNDKHVFRFPRTKALGKKDYVENKFLKIFALDSSILVPQMIGHFDEKTSIKYQTYEFIKGMHLSKELAATLAEQELIIIATEMGRFLTKLHSFSLSQARDMGMDELDPIKYGDYFKEFLKKDKEIIFPLLSTDEQVWIEKLIKDFTDLTRDKPFEVKVTHFDMLPEHIIIDTETHKLNGIIDFSLRIADPARDFTFFDRYGDIFLQTVYEKYDLSKDEYFDRRRKFYAGNLSVVNFYQSLERKDDKMIKIHLAQLKEYIKDHG